MPIHHSLYETEQGHTASAGVTDCFGFNGIGLLILVIIMAVSMWPAFKLVVHQCYLWKSFAVKWWEHIELFCIDDKTIVPVGNKTSPFTLVANYLHSRVLAHYEELNRSIFKEGKFGLNTEQKMEMEHYQWAALSVDGRPKTPTKSSFEATNMWDNDDSYNWVLSCWPERSMGLCWEVCWGWQADHQTSNRKQEAGGFWW